MGDLPLHATLGFDSDGKTYAFVKLTEHFKDIEHPEQYFLAPAMRYNPETKAWDILEYSFVHVSQLPTESQHMQRLKEYE